MARRFGNRCRRQIRRRATRSNTILAPPSLSKSRALAVSDSDVFGSLYLIPEPSARAKAVGSLTIRRTSRSRPARSPLARSLDERAAIAGLGR